MGLALTDSNATANATHIPDIGREFTSSLDNDDPKDLRLVQAVRRFPKVVLYIFAVCPAILLWGFDLVIVSTLTSMPGFQADYGAKLGSKYIIPSAWLGVWTAIVSLGNMAGAAMAGIIHDKFGRRFSLAFGAVVSAIGIGICFACAFSPHIATRRGIFLLGKAVEGIAAGQVICTAQTYSSEIAPRSLRGPTQALLPAMTMLGQLVGALVVFACLNVDGRWGYLIAIASQWVFSVVLVVLTFLIPESPPYLVRKGKLEDARKAQRRLHRVGVDTDAAVSRLITLIEQEREDSRTAGSEVKLSQCFKGVDLRRTVIVVIGQLAPQFFGLSLLSNASYFAQTIGMKPYLSVLMLEIGIAVGLVANIISVWTLSFAKRRPLMLVTTAITGIIWGAIGISGCFNSPVTKWFTAAGMIVIIFVCGNGVWPVSVLAAAETSSLRLRGQTQAVGWFVHSICSCAFAVSLPYIYNNDQGNLGAKIGFIYLGFCSLNFALMWLYVPEMFGRSAFELDIMFTSRIPTRKFGVWSLERDYKTEEYKAGD